MKATTSFLLAAVVLSGCSIATTSDTTDQSEDAILGGIPASSTKFDAVGVLYGVRPNGAAPICTGTLIGPHTVLAAAHCVRPRGAPFDIIDRFPVYFAIGFDSAAPAKRVRAIWGGISPVAGNDVGVYQLEEEPAGITPLPLATRTLGPTDVGGTFTVVGYGMQDRDDNFNQFLTRRAVRLPLTTFEPKAAQVLFPEFADFKAFMERNAGHPFEDAAARTIYDHTILGPTDAFFGAPSNPQTAYLDSGGPFIAPDETGKLSVYAVQSRSYVADPTQPQTGTAKDLLPIGAAAALANVAGTAEFVASSLADRCRNVPTTGLCSATTAIRCGTELDPPVIGKVECAEFGAVCKIGADGVAACADP